jgi:hypothetical protein
MPASHPGNTSPRFEDEEEEPQLDQKIKIAWRYDQMKKFQTTVSSSTPYVSLSTCWMVGANAWCVITMFLGRLRNIAEHWI